jgi:hypothetical protein
MQKQVHERAIAPWANTLCDESGHESDARER